jgi:hypothetical protein
LQKYLRKVLNFKPRITLVDGVGWCAVLVTGMVLLA